MDLELKTKIDKFKCCFTVEGVPIVKSDRFTPEEYAQLQKESDAHASHWLRMAKNKKTYTDEEIADQIRTLMYGINVSPELLSFKIEKELKNLQYADEENEKKQVLDNIYKFLGWKNSEDDTLYTPFDNEFWSGAGSAPYEIKDTDSNKKLVALKQKYGACGMRELFGEKFNGSYDIRSLLSGIIYNFSTQWKQQYELKKSKEKIYSSEYNSLEEIEDNVVVKKIKTEAEKFFRDKTKDFKERCAVFDEHGGEECYIFHPVDKSLNKIFGMYYERDCDRHFTENTLYIIEWWMDYLEQNRTHISYKRNNYHPDVKSSKRNYVPSQEAIDRLDKYYTEKLFLEGIAKFTFDW